MGLGPGLGKASSRCLSIAERPVSPLYLPYISPISPHICGCLSIAERAVLAAPASQAQTRLGLSAAAKRARARHPLACTRALPRDRPSARTAAAMAPAERNAVRASSVSEAAASRSKHASASAAPASASAASDRRPSSSAIEAARLISRADLVRARVRMRVRVRGQSAGTDLVRGRGRVRVRVRSAQPTGSRVRLSLSGPR